MSVTETARELQSLIKKLRGKHSAGLDRSACGPVIDPGEPILSEMLRSFLVWESTCAKAAAALKRVEQAVVDFNELRVCLPEELIRLMGERYPRVEERAQRLRAVLNELFIREHAVTLEHLPRMSKRECREYLDSLEGMPRFVSSRVMLMALEGHCAPVDGRIHRRLLESEIFDAKLTADEAAASIEHSIRAGELHEAYLLLQAWSDEAAFSGEAEPAKAARKPAARPVARGGKKK